MKKARRLIKRYIALILVLLFSIESFAAVVGDNDGAAFITKAEFDSMKNDFQSQLDRYNSSLDNKIDGAISSYLEGVKVAHTENIDSVLFKCNAAKEIKWSGSWVPPYTEIGNVYQIMNSFQLTAETFAYTDNGSHVKTTPAQTATLGIFFGTVKSTVPTWVNFGDRETYIVQPTYNSSYGRWAIDVDQYWKVTPTAVCISSAWTTPSDRGWWIKGDTLADSTFQINVNPATFSNANSSFGTQNFTGSLDGTIGNFSYEGSLWPSLKYLYMTNTTDQRFPLGGGVWTNQRFCQTLAGNKVTGDLFCVRPEDWNTTHNEALAYYNTDSRLGWISFSASNNNGSGWSPYHTNIVTDNAKWKGERKWFPGAPKIAVYMKKWFKISAHELILNQWSTVAGDQITYYSGVPVCSVQSNGTIKLPLKFTFDATGASFDFAIRDTAFTNNDALDTPNVPLYIDSNLTTDYNHPTNFSGTTYEKTLFFRAEKDKTYWIKIKPKNSIDVAVNTLENTLEFLRDN